MGSVHVFAIRFRPIRRRNVQNTERTVRAQPPDVCLCRLRASAGRARTRSNDRGRPVIIVVRLAKSVVVPFPPATPRFDKRSRPFDVATPIKQAAGAFPCRTTSPGCETTVDGRESFGFQRGKSSGTAVAKPKFQTNIISSFEKKELFFI